MNDILDELNNHDRADWESARSFVPFHSDAISGLELGADALLYVMAHDHAITVPTTALHFAEKVAVISIARRDTAAAILRDVNRAINVIASTLRMRERLDREDQETAQTADTSSAPAGRDKPNLGPMAPLQPVPVPRPPSGQKVDIQF